MIRPRSGPRPRVHVSMPHAMHAALQELAVMADATVPEIARAAIEAGLPRVRREAERMAEARAPERPAGEALAGTVASSAPVPDLASAPATGAEPEAAEEPVQRDPRMAAAIEAAIEDTSAQPRGDSTAE